MIHVQCASISVLLSINQCLQVSNISFWQRVSEDFQCQYRKRNHSNISRAYWTREGTIASKTSWNCGTDRPFFLFWFNKYKRWLQIWAGWIMHSTCLWVPESFCKKSPAMLKKPVQYLTLDLEARSFAG